MNLNNYRNAHWRTLAPAKKNFTNDMKGYLDPIINQGRVCIEYILYVPSQRKLDTNNVLTVVDKFFSDALVKYGVVDDDNFNYILSTKFSFGGVNKKVREKYVRIIVTPIPDHISSGCDT